MCTATLNTLYNVTLYNALMQSIMHDGTFTCIGVQPTTFSDWEKLDSVEVRDGERAGKPREKITSIQTMLDIINQSQQDVNNT